MSIGEQIRDAIRNLFSKSPTQRPVQVRLAEDAVSPFGEPLAVEITPLIQVYLERLEDPRVWTQTILPGGSMSARDNGGADLNIDATLGATSKLQTRHKCDYHPGQGNIYRWTCTFNKGVSGSIQQSGPFHEEGGFGFGFNGEEFGVFHLYGRRLEIRTLTLTASAGAESATITLNGSVHVVPLSGVGTTEDDAREVGLASPFVEGATTWNAWPVGSKVYFVRQLYGDASGTYSYSSTGTSVGAVARTQSGADGTLEWTPRAEWSIDPMMDVYSRSGVAIVPTNGQVFETRVPYLGFGGPTFFIHDPNSFRAWPVHHIAWNNTDKPPDPTVIDPRSPITYSLVSSNSSTPMMLSGVSAMGAVAGTHQKDIGPPWSAVGTSTVGSTEVPILSICAATVHGGKINRRSIRVRRLLVSNEGSKLVRINLYSGVPGDLTGFKFLQPNPHSYLTIDKASTAVDTATMNQEMSVTVVAGATVQFEFEQNYERGEVLTVTGEVDASTTPVTVSFMGSEQP